MLKQRKSQAMEVKMAEDAEAAGTIEALAMDCRRNRLWYNQGGMHLGILNGETNIH